MRQFPFSFAGAGIVLSATMLTAQTATDPNAGLRMVVNPAAPHAYEVSWWGKAGHTYFIGYTDDLLASWSYFPAVEPGQDAILRYGFTNPAPKVFVRLSYYEETLADPFGTDSDGDGLSNQQEFALGTDPFSADSDRDGLPDAWELANRMDPLESYDGFLDYDGDEISNAQELANGTNPFLHQNHVKSYAITKLPLPAGAIWPEVTGMNDQGQVVGNVHFLIDDDRIMRAVVWTHGQPSLLPNLAGGAYAYASDVNNHGVVVGYAEIVMPTSFGPFSTHHAVRWPAEGGVFDLNITGLGAYGSSSADGINDSGVIAGSDSRAPIGSTGAFRWTAPGAYSYLPKGDMPYVYSSDINASGAILLNPYTIWTASSGLFTPEFDGGGNAINNWNEGAGIYYSVGYQAAFWNAEGELYLLKQPANGAETLAYDLNDQREVVGVIRAFDYETTYAAYWHNGELVYLDDRLDLSLGWSLHDAGAINSWGQIAGIGDINGEESAFLLTPAALVVDVDNDGLLSLASEQFPDVTIDERPFRFWSNDDDDSGDLANNDVPDQAPNQATGGFVPPGADYWTGFTGWGEVDGRTDLADLFPVFLDIKQLLNVLPPSAVVAGQTQSIVYKLKNADGALNFVYTNVTRSEAYDYLRHSDERVAYGYPGLPEVAAHEARTERITVEGTPLHPTFLDRIKNEADKGVILVEGRQPTDAPLRLVVEKDGVEIAEVTVNIKISRIEDMYRWINLRAVSGQAETRATEISQPSAYPDALTNGKMFVWVHGYNVNEEQSRGWNAEAFKRMWHSGSKAMFTAVSWHGDYSQRQLPFIGLVAPDYWDNIPHAFLTAQALAPLVNALPGSSKVIAGHSMGNIVASSAIKDHGMNVAKYLMVDAAVALEAYDTSVSTTGPYYVNAMRPIGWDVYDRRLWSTDWWQLFPEGDNRRRLTWMNRFGNISNSLNIYSSGEEVLNNNDLRPGELPYALLPVGTERTWIQQEMSKGGGSAAGTLTGAVAGEIQGGWGVNEAWGSQVWTPDPLGGGSYTYIPPSVADANALTDAQIRAQPFFTRFNKASLMHADVGAGSSGSDAADEATRADLLGGAIPALSFPAGRNPVPLFNSTSRNQNLMELQDGWPAGRPNTRWLHSDIRDVAYFFNYGAWDFFTIEGNLK